MIGEKYDEDMPLHEYEALLRNRKDGTVAAAPVGWRKAVSGGMDRLIEAALFEHLRRRVKLAYEEGYAHGLNKGLHNVSGLVKDDTKDWYRSATYKWLVSRGQKADGQDDPG